MRERLEKCRLLESHISTIFPSAQDCPTLGGKGSSPADETPPQIPGYQIESVLGRGGMGVVYKAIQLKLNRQVALKMLLAGVYASPQERAWFALEAQAIASLRHEHIVQVYDVGELEGRRFFTMEYVEGGSLAQRLAAGALGVRESATLAAKLARAVEIAHQSGIVHRDLKPANILLTHNGTPKISDFGLALRFRAEPMVARGTARIGTLSYMAPEQASGKVGAAGPLVDVHALGAILYEMLAGRRPFGDGTSQQIERKLLGEDPPPPSRANAPIPRDLQMICLKCLHKDPQRRYGTASALADDLDRFLRGESVMARPAGFMGRAAKWVRRRPSEAALIASGAIAAFALVSGVLWIRFDRAATAEAVSDDLREVARHEAAMDWTDSRIDLERGKARLGRGGSELLARQLRQADDDLNLVGRLAAIAMDRGAVTQGRFNIQSNNARADRQYQSAFREAGYAGAGDEPQAVADRIAASQVRDGLVAALDNWAACAPDSRRSWVLSTARLADRLTGDQRDRLRESASWTDRDKLAGLTQIALQARPSVQLLVALGDRLQEIGGDAVPFLKQVQQEHPDDFWANFALGEALRKQHPIEAIRYFQAAVAVNPRAAVAYNNLGMSLADDGRVDEAVDAFRLALQIDPEYVPAHNNLGIHLNAKGRQREAITHYEQALRGDPDDAETHNNLGIALRDVGRTEEAINQFLQALRIRPAYLEAHSNIGLALAIAGRTDEAIEHYRVVLSASDNDAATHNNIGLALVQKGRLGEAIEHFRRAVQINPNDWAAHNNLALALKAMGNLDDAIAQFREVIRLNSADRGARDNLADAIAARQRLGEKNSKPHE